ncbi:MAG: lipoprotein-releasing system permease protein [Saprospiraceae bacterium]|jgi:lipoprotein-releasing system permease protein
MNLSLKIARRYLFANSISGVLLVLALGYVFLLPFLLILVLFKKITFKSINAINIISGISVFGISLGTAALILVLSVFNGFEDLISGLFSTFNPDVKITALKGKTFTTDSTLIAKLKMVDGVVAVSQTLEETAFFEYKGSRDFGTLKGVDEEYTKVTGIDSTIREGDLIFEANGRQYAVLGVGMRNKLSVNVDNEFTPITVYMAKKSNSVTRPFIKKYIYPAGTFVIQQDFDNQYILSSLDFARKLLNVTNQVSALELRMDPDKDPAQILSGIEAVMGDDFIIKDRYHQDEAFLKLMNIEKWLSYAILALTMILVAFNMIGSLWMIVLDKKKDIAILKSMGATNKTVRRIFLNQGLLLCSVGMVFGFVIAILLYLLQITYGVVPIPQGFVVNAYPVSMRFNDFVVVTITVLSIGLLASVLPALKASRISALVREE